MQTYLFIGGNWDGLNIPLADDSESVELPVGVKGRETYTRSTLSLGDTFITVYIHECVVPMRVLDRLVEYYKAWAVNRPGGRR
jgi:hypothetical protein